MTWRASAWARKLRTGSPARKAVLLVLAEEADQWGWALVGQEEIAWEADIGGDKASRKRQARRHLTWLAEHGLVTIYQGRSRGGQLLNLYYLNFPALPKDPMPATHPSRSRKYTRVAVELKPLEMPVPEEQDEAPAKAGGGAVAGDTYRAPATNEADDAADLERKGGGSGEESEGGPPGDKLSAGRGAGLDPAPGDSGVLPCGQNGHNQRTPVSSTETPVPRKDFETCARDPGSGLAEGQEEARQGDRSAGEGGGSEAGPGEPGDVPVSALWQRHLGEIRRALPVNWQGTLHTFFPDSDDGETYVVAALNTPRAENFERECGAIVAGILGRAAVRCEVRGWVAARLFEENRRRAHG